ncbi:MAG: hypothetical protein DWQ05_12630 [Calditrichaeota bacterium]|nr:MAG: hypothetical protein DWQ05_12630 [Calditrichota bacterium]
MQAVIFFACALFFISTKTILESKELSPTVLVEIDYRLAGKQSGFLQPISLDIDNNGDFYVGCRNRILVYNKRGELLKNIDLSKVASYEIIDICLLGSDRLLVLKTTRSIFEISKYKDDIRSDNIIQCYYVKNNIGFNRIYADFNEIIYIGTTINRFYDITKNIVREKLGKYFPVKYIEFDTENYVNFFPQSFGGEKTLLKETNNRDTIEIINKNTINISRTKLLKAISDKKTNLDNLSIRNIYSTSNGNRIFIDAFASENSRYKARRPKIRKQKDLKRVLFAVSRSGEILGKIENMPTDDYRDVIPPGKKIIADRNGNLFYLYTKLDNKNIKNSMSYILKY